MQVLFLGSMCHFYNTKTEEGAMRTLEFVPKSDRSMPTCNLQVPSKVRPVLRY